MIFALSVVVAAFVAVAVAFAVVVVVVVVSIVFIFVTMTPYGTTRHHMSPYDTTSPYVTTGSKRNGIIQVQLQADPRHFSLVEKVMTRRR